MILTDEEMWDIACEFQKDILETGEIGKLCKAIRVALLKKVVEWGIEICSEHLPKWEGRIDLMGGVLSKRECHKCWQALLEEVK